MSNNFRVIPGFLTENDYYYSVGLYTSRGEKNDAWKTAEERAFINLISFTGSLVISYTSLETSGNKKGQVKEHLEQATSNTFDHTIIDGQVMERWPDLQNNLYYVLVRAHKDNIIGILCFIIQDMILFMYSSYSLWF